VVVNLANSSQKHSLQVLTPAFAVDIVSIALFGVDPSNLNNTTFNDESNKDRHEYDFHTVYNDIFAMDFMGKLLMLGDCFFPTRWIPCESNRRFLFATNWLLTTLGRLVQDRRRDFKDSPDVGNHERSQDILSFLVEKSRAEPSTEGLTNEYIVGHVSSSFNSC
jgi:cytochrome P450